MGAARDADGCGAEVGAKARILEGAKVKELRAERRQLALTATCLVCDIEWVMTS